MSYEIDRRTMLRLSAAGVVGGALAATASAARASAAGPRTAADIAASRIVASVRRPWFPGRYFPVTSFGATGGGTTLDTHAFAKAIAACHRAGGGHVVVPAGGTFLTGAIHLRSNVDLHVEQNATILFSQNPADYLPVVFTRWQGIELMNYSPFIYCYGQRNAAVTGAGTLNGQADANVPLSQRVFGAGHFLPPQMTQPFASDTVLFEGVTVINSPFWHLNPNLCTNVTVDGLTISSTGQNTDGCDPESCAGVVVQNVTYDTGDDCMAIKAGRDADGRRINVPCQNVVVQHCNFANGHGGITIGSEMTGGVKNVYARDLTMNSVNLQAGHRIKTNTLRGGYVPNTNVYRVTADVTLDDWTVDTCEGPWSIVGASASDPVGTATLENIAVTTSTAASSARYITDLVVKNVTVGRTTRNKSAVSTARGSMRRTAEA